MGRGTWPSIMKSHPPARKELLTTSIQRALQHLLKPIHLERLRQRRPVAIGLSQLAIPRRKDERLPRATRASATGETGWPLRLASRIARSKSAFFVAANASSMRAASAATV